MTPPEPPVTLPLSGSDERPPAPSPAAAITDSEVTATIDEIEHANAERYTKGQVTILVGLEETSPSTPIVEIIPKPEPEIFRRRNGRREQGDGRKP